MIKSIILVIVIYLMPSSSHRLQKTIRNLLTLKKQKINLQDHQNLQKIDQQQQTHSILLQKIVEATPYHSQVFCPINTLLNKEEEKLLQLYKIKFNKDLYVVSVQTYIDTRSPYSKFYYCGYARSWNGKCDRNEVKKVCSSPAPSFYVPVNQQIDVLWIHNLNTTNGNPIPPWVPGQTCFHPHKSQRQQQYCVNQAKTQKWHNCTFYYPTNLDNQSSHHVQSSNHKIETVTFDKILVSTHIHGLEVRPTFDGNPYSWMNGQNVGVGFISAQNKKYYQATQTDGVDYYEGLYKFVSRLYNKNQTQLKINRYPNKQSPGTLWYHNHGMHSFARGLTGMYILYDPKLSSQLPPIQQQKYIFIKNSPPKQRHPNDTDYPVGLQYDPNDKLFFFDDPKKQFKRNHTYLYRITNANFDSYYSGFGFYYFEDCSAGQCVEGAIKSKKLSDHNFHRIDFSIIGVDSTLRRHPIYPINQFSLSASERVDLLVRFDKVPKKISRFYIINVFNDEIKLVICNLTLSSMQYNNDGIPIDIKLIGLPFINLSKVATVAVHRMRPILRIPNFQGWALNGHPNPMMGSSQNPKIGTIQNWYIINTVSEVLHSIHTHLVNYQVFSQYLLRSFSTKSNNICTCYEMDFLKASQFFMKDKFGSNEAICNFIRMNKQWNGSAMEKALQHLYAEDKTLQIDGRSVSGLDLFTKYGQTDEKCMDNLANDCQGQYKYICKDTSNQIPIWYNEWKETAVVRPLHVLGMKLRWARTDYDPQDPQRVHQYFNIPQQHLIEFPGYVYHCHLIIHQNNQMMRFIMLQPSDYSKQTKNLTDWGIQAKMINKKLGCHLQ